MESFADWMRLKEQLHRNSARPPRVSEGDIWWTSIGKNIGFEIKGKSRLFSRPVIILKKYAHGFYFVIPTSTQKKDGSWYFHFLQKDRVVVACLHQARAMGHRRLSSKIGKLDSKDYKDLKQKFLSLYMK